MLLRFRLAVFVTLIAVCIAFFYELSSRNVPNRTSSVLDLDMDVVLVRQDPFYNFGKRPEEFGRFDRDLALSA